MNFTLLPKVKVNILSKIFFDIYILTYCYSILNNIFAICLTKASIGVILSLSVALKYKLLLVIDV